MIAIVNVGLGTDGKHKYKLMINHDEITEFEHNRDDGLSECLRLASESAKKHGNSEFMDYFIKASQFIKFE